MCFSGMNFLVMSFSVMSFSAMSFSGSVSCVLHNNVKRSKINR